MAQPLTAFPGEAAVFGRLDRASYDMVQIFFAHFCLPPLSSIKPLPFEREGILKTMQYVKIGSELQVVFEIHRLYVHKCSKRTRQEYLAL